MCGILTAGQCVGIESQQGPEGPKRVPGQNICTLGAVDSPPDLLDSDQSGLAVSNAECPQFIRWRGIRQHRTGCHLAAHSPISIKSTTGWIDSPCSNHAFTEFG